MLPEIDESMFQPLVEHLSKGIKVFGMAPVRGTTPDISKASWTDPRLHYLLMKFGLMYVPIPFTSVQISDSSKELKFDRQSRGTTYIVAFGSFTGGELVLKGDMDVHYNIRHRPMIFDTNCPYYTNEAVGKRWTIAFYSLKPKAWLRQLSDYEAVVYDGVWVIAWYRPGEKPVYLSKKNGLPRPKNKKKIKEVKEPVINNPRLSEAQNLLHRALTQE